MPQVSRNQTPRWALPRRLLGWRIYAIDKDALIYHSGWVKGYVAEIAWSPRHQLGLAVLLNAESPAIGRISTSFWAEVHGRAAPSP
jgi:beta-lactamase class C